MTIDKILLAFYTTKQTGRRMMKTAAHSTSCCVRPAVK